MNTRQSPTSKDDAAIAAVRAGITERRSPLPVSHPCEICHREYDDPSVAALCCALEKSERPIATPPATGEALPCPFCDHPLSRVEKRGHGHVYVCYGCTAQGPDSGDGKAGALAAWNRRAPEPAQAGARVRAGWVKCPICGEGDMRFEKEQGGDEGDGYIHCVNLACGSNGGTNFSAVPTPEAQRSPETGSLTPRTDAAATFENDDGETAVLADFARQLERELAEVSEQLTETGRAYTRAIQEARILRSEIALATDAADKGNEARRLAGAMEERARYFTNCAESLGLDPERSGATHILTIVGDLRAQLAASEAAKLAAETERDEARACLELSEGALSGKKDRLHDKEADLTASQAREASLRAALSEIRKTTTGSMSLVHIQQTADEALALGTEGVG